MCNTLLGTSAYSQKIVIILKEAWIECYGSSMNGGSTGWEDQQKSCEKYSIGMGPEWYVEFGFQRWFYADGKPGNFIPMWRGCNGRKGHRVSLGSCYKRKELLIWTNISERRRKELKRTKTNKQRLICKTRSNCWEHWRLKSVKSPQCIFEEKSNGFCLLSVWVVIYRVSWW